MLAARRSRRSPSAAMPALIAAMQSAVPAAACSANMAVVGITPPCPVPGGNLGVGVATPGDAEASSGSGVGMVFRDSRLDLHAGLLAVLRAVVCAVGFRRR